MKRILALLIALTMIALAPALAAESDTEALKASCIAEYEALCNQEQLTRLDMQILELELQRAQMMQNDSEIDRLTASIALHTQTLATLAIQKEDAAAAIVSTILVQEDELINKINALQSELHEAQAQMAAIQVEYSRFYTEYARAQLRLNVLTIFPAHSYEAVSTGTNDVILYKALNENGQQIGWCVKTNATGYAGTVAVTLGVDMLGCVTQARIGDDSFIETPGFGQRWMKETDRWAQFTDLSTTQGGVIEAITGATLTSNAVLNATNAALECVALASGTTVESSVRFGKLPTYSEKALQAIMQADGVLSATRSGFMSDVTVYATLDASGAISSLAVDSSGETVNFGTRVMEDEAFISQFIGVSVPMATYDYVDCVSGATITSHAVIDAINDVLIHANGSAVYDVVGEDASNDTLTASAAGFLGNDVGVTITLDSNGAIATLQIDLSQQFPPICDVVLADDFISQFIGQKGPFVIGENVDVVTGATHTSTGVIDALNQLFPID